MYESSEYSNQYLQPIEFNLLMAGMTPKLQSSKVSCTNDIVIAINNWINCVWEIELKSSYNWQYHIPNREQFHQDEIPY